MKKLSIVALSLIFAMTAVLAACSSKKSEEPPADQPKAEQPKTEEPKKEEQKTEDPKKETTEAKTDDTAKPEMKKYKGEIVISLNKNPKEIEGFDALAEAYKKVQPDVKLVWEPLYGPNGEYPTLLGTQLAAGTPRPDIVAGNYQVTYDKYLNFDKYRYQVNPYTGNKWDEDLDWNFFLAKNSKGERMMLPTQSVHIMWFYNKDVFDKLGLKPPTNWDELVDVSKKISDSGMIPVASNFVWKVPQWVIEIYNDQFTRKWHDIVRAQTGDYNYDDELDGVFKSDPNDPYIDLKYNFNPSRYYKAIQDGTIRFDTPEMTELVTNMSKMFPKYAQKDFFVSTDDYSLWLQQKAAMIIDGSWSLPQVEKDMTSLKDDPDRLKTLKITDASSLKPFDWGTFENPPMSGPLVQGPVRSVESATGEYVSIIEKNQEQTDMVLDFVMFWLSKVGYQPYVDGQVKANKFNPGGPVMVKGVKVPDNIDKMFGGIKMMGNAEITMNNPLSLAGDPDLSKAAFNLYKEALEGKTPADQFGKKLEELWTKNFDKVLKASGLTQDNLDHPERAPGK